MDLFLYPKIEIIKFMICSGMFVSKPVLLTYRVVTRVTSSEGSSKGAEWKNYKSRISGRDNCSITNKTKTLGFISQNNMKKTH